MSHRNSIQIAIVNDQLMTIQALRRLIEMQATYHIAWIAVNGEEAVAYCAKNIPDIILMDLIMPVMDGVEATRRIMQKCPCPILVVTASVIGNRSKTFAALSAGALDSTRVPSMMAGRNSPEAQTLLRKVHQIIQQQKQPQPLLHQLPKPSQSFQSVQALLSPLIVIGASTGGPSAVAKVLSMLDVRATVLIVMHVDKQFAIGMAEWLSSQSNLPVKVIAEGSKPQKGLAMLAVTNDHLRMHANQTLHYSDEPREMPYRPSIDIFFDSICQYWSHKAIGVLLTGMGRDGAQGLLHMRQYGWMTIAQNEDSCVVYGMPKAAAELDAAKYILAIDDMAAHINSIIVNALQKYN